MHAVLQTLAERIPDFLVDDIAGRLPAGIGDHLRGAARRGRAGAGSASARRDFIVRVTARSGLDGPNAAFASLAVFERLNAVVGAATMAAVRRALPSDLHGLATAGAPAPLSVELALPVAPAPERVRESVPRVVIRTVGKPGVRRPAQPARALASTS